MFRAEHSDGASACDGMSGFGREPIRESRRGRRGAFRLAAIADEIDETTAWTFAVLGRNLR